MNKKNKKLSIKKTTLFLILFFMFLFLPAFFQRNRIIRYIYYTIGSATSLLFCLKTFIFWRKEFNKYCIHLLVEVIIFYFILLVSTIMNSGSIDAYLAHAVIGIGTCTIVMDSICRNRTEETLEALIVSLEIYVTINFISVLLYPNGLYTIENSLNGTYNSAFILGHRNNAIEYIIPLIGFNILLELYQSKKYTLNHIYCAIISTITVISTWSVNAIICMMFLIGVDFYVTLKQKSFLVSIKNLYLCSASISIMLIVYNIQKYFAVVLEKYFRRSITLSSRTKIWERSLVAIANEPWYGYGIEDKIIKYRRIRHPNSCHNYFMDYLYYGGIVLLVSVSAMILTISNRLQKLDNIVRTRIAVIYGAYFILWIATPIHRDTIYLMFTLFMVSICIPWERKASNS